MIYVTVEVGKNIRIVVWKKTNQVGLMNLIKKPFWIEKTR